MEAKIPAWNTHDWDIRQVELTPGVTADQHTCRQCARHFIREKPTGSSYAIHIGLRQFDRLSEQVTSRWLSEPCAGVVSAKDIDDQRTRFSNGQSDRKAHDSPDNPDPENCTVERNLARGGTLIAPILWACSPDAVSAAI
jgi:hypothetical protein